MRMEGGFVEGWGQQTGDGQLERIQEVEGREETVCAPHKGQSGSECRTGV